MIPEVSPIEIVHTQVKVLPILKCTCHVDQKWMPRSCQKHSLVHYRAYRFLVNYLGLLHLFHRVDLFALAPLYLPYFSKSALAHRVHNLEVRTTDRSNIRLSIYATLQLDLMSECQIQPVIVLPGQRFPVRGRIFFYEFAYQFDLV